MLSVSLYYLVKYLAHPELPRFRNRLAGDELRWRDRDAEGADSEAPKALRGWSLGMGLSLIHI